MKKINFVHVICLFKTKQDISILDIYIYSILCQNDAMLINNLFSVLADFLQFTVSGTPTFWNATGQHRTQTNHHMLPLCPAHPYSKLNQFMITCSRIFIFVSCGLYSQSVCLYCDDFIIKGTVQRDFRLPVFFIIQTSLYH